MSLDYSPKICIFPKRLNHDSGQVFQISRGVLFFKSSLGPGSALGKNCKKRDQIGKISASEAIRAVSLADFFLLFPTIRSLVPGYLKETSVLSFDDVVFSKEGFLDDKNVILLHSKKLHFFKGVYP